MLVHIILLNLIFHKSPHYLQALVKQNGCPASSIKLFGQPLIVRNIAMAQQAYGITKVKIPSDFSDAIQLVQENFPSIDVEEFCESDRLISKVNIRGNENLEIPLNTLIQYSKRTNELTINTIIYPWEFLATVQKILYNEITEQVISPDASIANSSIIKGPCVIEDGVCVDDFCKVIGPVYLSNGSFIGMSSLIRNCVLGKETKIGFNCEIGRTYFAGNSKISHQNVLLDSIIGENVWFGGYSGTANVLLTRGNVKYAVGSDLVDTGTDHFGAVVGNNCAVGASVIILPGRQVPSDSIIQAGTVFDGIERKILVEHKSY
jgi:UDP-N-acetylglucosamine diphosphorylase / glucose-1-phosphate thymidylyltransferase / UDP-N-acetylgalactosamine diphosphorylase / glucosamine-1-phosphate N-acetyltransferase / galactosamine-1-phosphate N-acetyltransferase